MKKTITINRLVLSLATIASVGGLVLSQGAANAASTNSGQSLANIQSKATAAINQRLTTLSKLSGQISSSTKLSSSDRTTLATEVYSTTTGLTALKATIAAETNATQASTDAATIYSSYRVYALVVPKVGLVSTADNQLTKEAALTATSQKLQTEITTEQNAGKDVSSIQTQLNSMNSQISSAQSISSSVRQSVLPLLPSDWNANHSILSSYPAQLNTAYKDNTAANKDAVAITASIKALK